MRFTTLFVNTMFCALLTVNSYGQHVQLTGQVNDQNGEPVIGATVHLHETMQASHTGAEGRFGLTEIKPGQYHLHVQSLGYKSMEMPLEIKRDTSISVQLNETMHDLSELTIEASGMEEARKESALTTKRITGNRINENPSGNLMQSLESMPGIAAINLGTGVSKPVIRGLSNNRVVVAEGGIKQEGQQWGNDHGLEIDQFDTEAIEITKGPASLAYGSDAIAGVIHIARPELLPDGHHQFQTRTIFRSNNNQSGITGRVGGNYKGFIYRFNVTALSSGDYKVPADEFTYNNYVLPVEGNRLKNTAGRETHYSIGIGKQRTWGHTQIKWSHFKQQTGVFPGAIGTVNSLDLSDDGDDRNLELPFQDIDHKKVLWNTNFYQKKGWIEADIGYQFNDRKEFSAPHAHGRPVDFEDSLAHRLQLQTTSFNIKYSRNRSGNLEYCYGLQMAHAVNRINGYEFIIPPFRKIEGGLFITSRYFLNELTVFSGGLRFDYANVRVTSNELDFYYRGRFIGRIERNPAVDRHFSNYSAALGVVRQLAEHTFLRFNLGKTCRLPNVAELSANGVHHGAFRYEKGDVSMKPEEGYQSDLSLEFTTAKFNMQLSAFYNYFTNYIYLSPSGRFPTVLYNDTLYPYPGPDQMYQYRQVPVTHTGGELAMRYAVDPRLIFGTSAEYAYFRNNETGRGVSFTPPLSWKSSLRFQTDQKKKKKFRPYLELQYNVYASQNRTDINENATPGYQLINLLAGCAFGKRDLIELNGGIQNLTDEKYLNHLSRYRILNLPEPGINIFASLRIFFDFHGHD